MNKKLLLEIIPFTIFLIFGLFTLFKIKVPYGVFATIISGSFLAMIYFYASFWLFATGSLPAPIRILAGLIYSVNFVACIYTLFHWPYWKLFSIASYFGLGIILVVCLFNYRSPDYKPLFYRCILFLAVLSIIFGCRFYSI